MKDVSSYTFIQYIIILMDCCIFQIFWIIYVWANFVHLIGIRVESDMDFGHIS